MPYGPFLDVLTSKSLDFSRPSTERQVASPSMVLENRYSKPRPHPVAYRL